MVIHACAPNRILDIGNWSDTAFAEHGTTLNCAVNLFARVSLQPHGHDGLLVRGVHDLKVDGTARNYLYHDATIHDFIRVAARYFDVRNLEIVISSDVPPGCGTGTTAAMRVAVTAAFARYADKHYHPHQLALIAHRLQHEDVGGACGMQSFMAAAGGGIVLYRFTPYPRVFATHPPADEAVLTELEDRLLLVRTGRSPSHCLYQQLEKRYLAGDYKAHEVLWKLRALPWQALDALREGNWAELGLIMSNHTTLQQQLFPVLLTPEVRHISTIAHRYGALATMVNGTGGSMTILHETGHHQVLERELRLSGYHIHPVRINRTGIQVWETDSMRSPSPIPSMNVTQAV